MGKVECYIVRAGSFSGDLEASQGKFHQAKINYICAKKEPSFNTRLLRYYMKLFYLYRGIVVKCDLKGLVS